MDAEQHDFRIIIPDAYPQDAVFQQLYNTLKQESLHFMKTITICTACNTLNRVDLEKAQSVGPKCGHCQNAINIHGAVIDITPSSLNSIISAAKIPIVADFWAPWCGPCRAFAPAFEAASKEFGDRFSFVKLNTEEHPSGAEQYNIRGIPTMIVFRDGKETDRQSGAMSLTMFQSYLGRFLQKS